MKKLLLITGDLACGKSTFAKALSKRYKANLFFKDAMKELLGDVIGFSNREENLKLSRAAVEVMTAIFLQSAALDKDLILEANFRTHELEKLHAIAADHGYDVLTLVLRGDNRILHERFLHRISHENRHPVHIIGDILDFENFVPYIERARGELIPGETLTMQADDFSYQTDSALLGRLDRFMGCGAKEHTMQLGPEPFGKIKSGRKTIELRLYDEKRQQIGVGDTIRFVCTEGGESLCAKVRSLHLFPSFEELYSTLPLTACGYAEEELSEASPADMEQYYTKDEQARRGVVGIGIEVQP